jgi:hypothetical protein
MTSFMQTGMVQNKRSLMREPRVSEAISLLSTAQAQLYDKSKGGAILMSVISTLKAKPL